MNCLTPSLPDSNPWDIPNGLDRAFEAYFRGRHQAMAGTVLCGSPWLDADLAGLKGPPGPRIGVNLTAMARGADYCLNCGDVRFLALANPRLHPRLTFVLACVDTVIAWLNVHSWPENVRLYTSPPVLPPGITETQRGLPRVYQGHNLSGPAALWLAWYMGLDPIRLCGCHCRLSPAGEYYGTKGMLEELIPDEAERRKYLATARGLLPEFARKTLELVEVIRADGVTIDWPGETSARESARQEMLT